MVYRLVQNADKGGGVKNAKNLAKGASIKYVRAEGEGGVGPNADVRVRLSKRGCVNLRTRGGRGSKKPKNLRTYLMEAP